MEKLYKDEQGRIFSESELENEFYWLRMEQETEAQTFAEYLRNCTDKNGTLTEIAYKYENKETGELYGIEDMDRLYCYYVQNNLIDDHGFVDFLNGATDEATGLYKIV